MAVTYILRDTTVDIPAFTGADFELDLTPGAAGTSNPLVVSVANSTTEVSYAATEAGVPGTNGTSTGTFTVEVNVTAGNTSMTLTVSLVRINAAGASQATVQLSNPGTSLGQAGVKTFSATDPALGTWNSGDRLMVAYAFSSSQAHGGAASVTIDRNTTDCQVITPFSAGATQVNVGLVTETDTPQIISRVTARDVNLTTETDTAQVVTHTKARAVGLVTETDTAQAQTRRKRLLIHATGAVGSVAVVMGG